MNHVTGLLVLTQPVRALISNLPMVLHAASQHVSKTLYIHLDPLAKTHLLEKTKPLTLYSRIITNIYTSSPTLCRDLDVRVLLAGFKGLSEVQLKTHATVDVVIFDQVKKNLGLIDLERKYNKVLACNDVIFLGERHLSPRCEKDVFSSHDQYVLSKEDQEEERRVLEGDYDTAADKVYPSVVIGGTFDCIHAGHKILLSEALLRCQEKLTCGVSAGPLLKNKTLAGLILPTEKRISNVRELAIDLDPSVKYVIVPIREPMGPTRTDPEMDLIVVSEETKKGIAAINKVRENSGLKILDGHIIKLVEDKLRTSPQEEEKISASSLRMRKLGTLLQEPAPNSSIPDSPYMIGLTGGSASGKSSIAKRLEGLGASVIDCDKLGHEAYAKNTDCYRRLIEVFGSDIIGEDGEINRRVLGGKVFASKTALQELNDIVWPEIMRIVKERVASLRNMGAKVVVLDAAVLLKAGWDVACHQVWVSVLRREEAIRRIMERDGKTQEEADQRLSMQMSNKELVARANVVMCTEWSGEYTQQQVERAWATLKDYVPELQDNMKSQM